MDAGVLVDDTRRYRKLPFPPQHG